MNMKQNILTTLRKGIAIFVLAIIMLTSCINKPGERTRLVEKELPIETFIKSFVDEHKDFNTNDITREKANNDFCRILLDTLEKDNILKGIPVKLSGISEKDGKCTVQFRSWITPSGFEYKNNIYEVYFDIVGTIPDSLATVINDKEYYTFDGKFVSRVDGIRLLEVLLGKNTTAYTNSICIEQQTWNDKVNVSMGILYFDINNVQPFKGREKVEEKY